MPAFDTLLTAQITLIVTGVVFQIMAMTALRKESAPYQRRKNPEGDESASEETYMLAGTARRQSARITRQRDGSHDYYEIERTPPGVRPSELTKTAKVTYFD